MRYLYITLLAVYWAGCTAADQPEKNSQTSKNETLVYKNTKWGNTLSIEVLVDSLEQTIGYRLGGDTFSVDSNSRIDSATSYIRNSSLQAFIYFFSDTSAEKPIHPTLINRNEIDLLVCSESFLDTSRQWAMIDSGYSVAPIYFQEINLDNDRTKELVVEIIRDEYWEHLYRIYKLKENHYTYIDEISAINRSFWKAPIQRIEKSDYWAVTSLGWGTGYSAIYHTYYKMANELLIQMSDQITTSNFHSLYFLSSGEYATESRLSSEVNFPDPYTLAITYSYSLVIYEDTTEYVIIDQAHYRTEYTLHRTKNRFETKDVYLKGEAVEYDEEIELTPVFASELERLKKHGTPLQKRLLKDYQKED